MVNKLSINLYTYELFKTSFILSPINITIKEHTIKIIDRIFILPKKYPLINFYKNYHTKEKYKS